MATNQNNNAYHSAKQIMLEFDTRVSALDDLVHLTVQGIRHIEYMPELLRAIDTGQGSDRLQSADRQAALAKNEIKNEFPLLFSQATISLWAALEGLIRTLIASLLRDEKSLWECEEFSKVKVKITDYEMLQGIDRYLYVVDTLEEATGTRRRSGIERFEHLFRVLGMSSPVPSDVATCLLELYSFRNVIIHRHGLVDRRLLKDCPWLKLSEGEELHVTHAQYHQHMVALNLYMFVLVNRIRVLFGKEPITHDEQCHYSKNDFEYKTAASKTKPIE